MAAAPCVNPKTELQLREAVVGKERQLRVVRARNDQLIDRQRQLIRAAEARISTYQKETADIEQQVALAREAAKKAGVHVKEHTDITSNQHVFIISRVMGMIIGGSRQAVACYWYSDIGKAIRSLRCVSVAMRDGVDDFLRKHLVNLYDEKSGPEICASGILRRRFKTVFNARTVDIRVVLNYFGGPLSWGFREKRDFDTRYRYFLCPNKIWDIRCAQFCITRRQLPDRFRSCFALELRHGKRAIAYWDRAWRLLKFAMCGSIDGMRNHAMRVAITRRGNPSKLLRRIKKLFGEDIYWRCVRARRVMFPKEYQCDVSFMNNTLRSNLLKASLKDVQRGHMPLYRLGQECTWSLTDKKKAEKRILNAVYTDSVLHKVSWEDDNQQATASRPAQRRRTTKK